MGHGSEASRPFREIWPTDLMDRPTDGPIGKKIVAPVAVCISWLIIILFDSICFLSERPMVLLYSDGENGDFIKVSLWKKCKANLLGTEQSLLIYCFVRIQKATYASAIDKRILLYWYSSKDDWILNWSKNMICRWTDLRTIFLKVNCLFGCVYNMYTSNDYSISCLLALTCLRYCIFADVLSKVLYVLLCSQKYCK